jgi:hypothetical protein
LTFQRQGGTLRSSTRTFALGFSVLLAREDAG